MCRQRQNKERISVYDAKAVHCPKSVENFTQRFYQVSDSCVGHDVMSAIPTRTVSVYFLLLLNTKKEKNILKTCFVLNEK